MDLGTGDGRAVLARATAEPRTLVVGLDADASAMADASRRAAAAPRKGGLPNALFVVAAAERPPTELLGLAEELAITLPWGSLLTGVLGRDAAVLDGIAALVRPGGRVHVLWSMSVRDRAVAAGAGAAVPLDDDEAAAAIVEVWRCAGFESPSIRAATGADLADVRSSWARRLRLATDGRAGLVVSPDRRAWRLTAIRG